MVIERNLDDNVALKDCYNILYAKDFNPNHSEYFVYARAVRKEIIPSLLIELSKVYFRQLNPEKDVSGQGRSAPVKEELSESYQCSNCVITSYSIHYTKLYEQDLLRWDSSILLHGDGPW